MLMFGWGMTLLFQALVAKGAKSAVKKAPITPTAA